MNGFQVAEELVARLPSTLLLIAVTGYGEAEVKERADRSGFHQFLVKPADPVQIDALLRAYRARGAAGDGG